MKDSILRIISELQAKLRTIELELSKPNLEPEAIKRLSVEHSRLKEIIELHSELRELENDIEFWKQMEAEDPNVLSEMENVSALYEKKFLHFLSLLLPGDENHKSIIVEIRAGTGGEEAALFAADLYRMYSRYAERKDWHTELVDFHDTGLGGFKEIVFFIKGNDVFKAMKYERGVHRVQRIPLTESGGRIHTSTATVAVLPEVSSVEIDIDPKDIRIDTYKASGHGGQHVNKTESAIRITHIPTGLVVTCQSERSQRQNKEQALKVLRARLYQLQSAQLHSQMADSRRNQIGSGERSEKIRTYNFPQNRVTDHRINYTSYRLQEILDGDLEELQRKLMEHEIMELINSKEQNNQRV